MGPFSTLDSWQLAELAVLFVELDLAGEAERIVVEHDVKLRDVRSERLRQIDVLIRATVNEHEFLRVVEVQRRKEPVGLPQLDEWITKARNVGAHRLTVAAAQYRKSALTRIANESEFVQAYHLRPAAPSDWPFPGDPPPLDISFDERIEAARRSDFIYGRIGDSGGRYVSLANVVTSGGASVLAVLFEPDPEFGGFKPSLAILDRSRRPIQSADLVITYGMPDGNSGELRTDGLQRRPPLHTGPLARKRPVLSDDPDNT